MKTIIFYAGLLISLLAFGFSPARATHIWGADMSWIQITKDSYVVTVNIYRDCNGVPLTKKEKIVVANTSGSKTYNLGFKSVLDITPVCRNQCTSCNGPSCTMVYGIQKYTMTAGLRLDTRFCEYTISYQDTNRSDYIINGGLNEKFYISSYLNRCYGNDNSPLLRNEPLLITGQNICVTYNPSATDTDRNASGQIDSLSYKLIPSKTSPTTMITYTGKYTYDKPLYFDSFPHVNALWNPPSCRGFHFDSISGDLNFKPTKVEVVVIAFAISEWRKDKSGKYIKIGEIERDLAVGVLKFPNNHAPTLTGINGTSVTDVNFCTGVMNCFTLNSNDPDPKDTVSYFYDSTYFPKGSTVTVEHGKKHPRLTFCWKPDATYNSANPFTLAIGYRDNACPLRLSETKTFRIYVKPGLDDSITINSKCQDATFKAVSKSANSMIRYAWTGDDSLRGTGPIFTHHYPKAASYKYTLTASYGYGCNKRDSGIVNITLNPSAPAIISVGMDSLVSTGHGIKYSWYKDSLPLKDTGNYIYPAHNGTYTVQLIDSNGCASALSNPFLYTDIKAGLNNNKLHIYPNPTTGLLTIEAGGIKEAQLSIINLTGQVQYTNIITEKAELDLHALAKGIYFIKISTNANNIIQKLVIN